MPRKIPKVGQKTMVVWELKSPGDPLSGTGKSWARKVIDLVKPKLPWAPPEPEVPPQEELLTSEEFAKQKERGKITAGGGVERERFIRGNYTADLTEPEEKL